eukprot:4700394-Prymnesium_polylepis.1
MSKGVTDLTPSPVGKRWVMDTLKLRTVSFLGNMALQRFVVPTSNKSKTFGIKGETSAEMTSSIDLLRAFNRPLHGELMVIKNDQYPTLMSKEYA